MKTIGKLLAGLLIGWVLLSFIGCSTDSDDGTKTWTVTFDKNNDTEGSTEANPRTMNVADKGTVKSLPANPTRPGYTFKNWNLQEDGKGDEFTTATIVTGKITVYAQWTTLTSNQRVVTFDKNTGDTEANPQTKAITVNRPVGDLPEPPTKKGFIFVGWNADKDGKGDVFSAETIITNHITVYAQWVSEKSIMVTFDKNGGNTEANPSYKIVASSGGTVGTLPEPPTRAGGWVFDKWTMEENGGSEFTESTPVTASIKVYAQWIAAFTVTFNKNAPEHASATTNASPDYMVVGTAGGSVGTLPTPPVYATAWGGGVTFDGWYTIPGATGGTQFTETTPVSGDIIVYARWKFTPGTPTEVGETLVHNTPAIEGGTLNADGSSTYSDGTIRYKFADNIGDYDFAEITYIKQGTVRVVTENYEGVNYIPSRTSTGETGIYQTIADSGSITFEIKYNPTGGVGLRMNNYQQTNNGTVKFTKVTYSKGNRFRITFDTNDGDYVGEKIPDTFCVEGTSIGIPLPVPERDGYLFGGWYTDLADQSTLVTDGTTVTEPLNLKAKWNVKVDVAPMDVTFTADRLIAVGSGASVAALNDGNEFSLVYGSAGYNGTYAKFKVTLPEGATLGSYTNMTLQLQGTKGDTGWKPVTLYGGKPITGTTGTTQRVSDEIQTGRGGGESWFEVTLTLDKAKAGALDGEIELCIYIHCATTGDQGAGGATEWHFRNVKLNP